MALVTLPHCLFHEKILAIFDVAFGALGLFEWFPPRVITEAFLLISIDQSVVPMLSDDLFSAASRYLVPLYDFKNVKNTHGGVLHLDCNFTKSNTPP